MFTTEKVTVFHIHSLPPVRRHRRRRRYCKCRIKIINKRAHINNMYITPQHNWNNDENRQVLFMMIYIFMNTT